MIHKTDIHVFVRQSTQSMINVYQEAFLYSCVGISISLFNNIADGFHVCSHAVAIQHKTIFIQQRPFALGRILQRVVT